ncbi:MAG TPA: double zinc ribbon domain-containing protein [Clostridia bacterium]|nr:double zinc ribbon domain-containing protein [Clostridia bacterium]
MMRRAAAVLLDLLFPKDCVCLGCGRLLVDDAERQLCSDCAEALRPLEGPRCPVCNAPTEGGGLCKACVRLPDIARVPGSAPYAYADTAQALVHALKFQQVRIAAVPLALGMLEILPKDFDNLVPVPLHRRRERERGFNQARLLCEALAERGGPPVLDALVRARATKPQSKLPEAERWKNLVGAFYEPFTVLGDLATQPVAGKRLILVDDVRTTGATTAACAEALYAGGCREVRVCTATAALAKKT